MNNQIQKSIVLQLKRLSPTVILKVSVQLLTSLLPFWDPQSDGYIFSESGNRNFETMQVNRSLPYPIQIYKQQIII